MPNVSLKLLVGDQANITTLSEWIVKSQVAKKKFDIIVDDGGHGNTQIFNSFQSLFPSALAPGGLYFIEDLHVGRETDWKDATNQGIIMIDVIKDYIEQLVMGKHTKNHPSISLASYQWNQSD